MSLIEKAYFTLEEVEERWNMHHRDLVYLAENGLVRVSVRLFGVQMEFGVYEESADGEWFSVPQERSRYTGFQDLLERDVFSAAGGGIDITQRIIADKLGEIWGQQVVIVNRPGAGGGISAKVASQSTPDGYTLYSPATSPFLVLRGGPSVSPNLPLELPRDFAPIGSMVEQPFIIGASHKSGITDIATLIKVAKERPGEVAYAATGRGRVTHLTMELLQSRTGTRFQLVPYAGGTPQAMGDILSGRIPLIIDGLPGLAGAVKGNTIKGLAVTSAQRLPGFEDVPTLAETIPGLVVGAFVVLVAPLGTPDSIVSKVNADLQTALSDPTVKDKIAINGAFARYMKPEQLTEFVQEQQKTWLPIMERVEKEMQK